MTPGDKVNWLYESRGGYGYIIPVAAVVQRVTPKRVRIRAALKVRDGSWVPSFHSVKPEKLRTRTEHVPVVDDFEGKS